MKSSLFISLLLIIVFASTAVAMPQFAVRYGQSCQLCHLNPTRAGMRSLHGAQTFSYIDLPWKELDDIGKLDDYNPMVGKNFQFGVDFRSLFYTSDNAIGNSFLTMEGTFYAAISPSDKTTVYLAKGLYTAFEGYALFHDLPMSGAIRVGRFTPAYGWHFADHNAYTRNYLGYGMGRGMEDGVEVGLYPLEWEASASVTNGPAGIVDGDRGKVATLRAAKRMDLGPLKTTFGGSWRYAEFNLGKGQPVIAGIKRYVGPFWGVNWGKLTYLGEADWDVESVTALVVSHTASYLLRRGLTLSASYDFLDPDTDAKSGFNWRGRISGIYPTGYLELMPGFVWERISGRERGSGELQMHVWF